MALNETLLQTEVEVLSKRLQALDQEMDAQVRQLGIEQRSLVREASVSVRDLSESNLTLQLDRFLLSADDFGSLLEDGTVNELRDKIKGLVSKKTATVRPILLSALSPVSKEGKRPQFVISDQKNLNVPIDFEPVSGPQTENPDPKLAPKEWVKEDLGTSLTADLLAREDDKFLLSLKFEDITRLKNEKYPFPKIFSEKEPGHLEMPVFHQGEIETTITATVGIAEFIGTTIVPGFEEGTPDQFQAVFITILSSTKQ